jgi:murein DD-endopeptidase MepM/ murein hydrolase activator NlpD
MTIWRLGLGLLALAANFCGCSAFADSQPAFMPSGDLESGSGTGLHDETVHYPGMRFPIENAPAFANSQVYRPGGQQGGSGGQCANVNYDYPWRDNFCEKRDRATPLCPTGKGHQGQDIRPSSCKADLHWAVAVADGIISHIGSYSFTLQTPAGVLYNYLHVNLSTLTVAKGDNVSRGQKLAKVSNWFGGESTTIHLHFEIKDTVTAGGTKKILHIPPYASLVASYKSLLAGKP